MSSAALTRGTAKIVTVNQGGGSKKAGIVSTGGRSQFAMRAITHGHTHAASTFIPNPYPISGANQLGGIGRQANRGGMFGSNADGVNLDIIRNQANALCLVHSSTRRCGYLLTGALRPAGTLVGVPVYGNTPNNN